MEAKPEREVGCVARRATPTKQQFTAMTITTARARTTTSLECQVQLRPGSILAKWTVRTAYTTVRRGTYKNDCKPLDRYVQVSAAMPVCVLGKLMES
jgi:hypothetical protein